jgi:hypothetical protein
LSFLFSLNLQHIYECTWNDHAIYGGKEYLVGFGKEDLYIMNGCTTKSFNSAKEITYPGANNLAMRQLFKVDLIEIFEIIKINYIR